MKNDRGVRPREGTGKQALFVNACWMEIDNCRDYHTITLTYTFDCLIARFLAILLTVNRGVSILQTIPTPTKARTTACELQQRATTTRCSRSYKKTRGNISFPCVRGPSSTIITNHNSNSAPPLSLPNNNNNNNNKAIRLFKQPQTPQT